MSQTKTEVIFNNGKNTDNGYVIKNPYATVQYLSIVLFKFSLCFMQAKELGEILVL